MRQKLEFKSRSSNLDGLDKEQTPIYIFEFVLYPTPDSKIINRSALNAGRDFILRTRILYIEEIMQRNSTR